MEFLLINYYDLKNNNAGYLKCNISNEYNAVATLHATSLQIICAVFCLISSSHEDHDVIQ